ncbi:MAG TPA: hypothetical protein VMT35_02310, partial [Ignavibacteriaceae bacterium]|nr:hypothetical protein [Ignavibacteriaceae bacterium]
MKTSKLFSLFILFVFLTGEDLALPRFALRMNAQCTECHVNPTGGEMRNHGGWSFGKNMLPMASPRDYKMSNMIGENISFGVDFRTQYLYSAEKKKTDFQKMEGTIYANVDLSEDINIFTRYDFIQQIFEGYGVARVLPNRSYIKAGAFSPNYGLRIDDHTAYTRGGDFGLLFTPNNPIQGLIFWPQYTEIGLETGLYFSNFALLTLSAGKPNFINPLAVTFPFDRKNTDPSYTANLQFTPQLGGDNTGLMFGGSYTNFKYDQLNNYKNANIFGGYAGFGIAGFTILGEFDVANDYISKDSSSTALMIEGAYELIKGLQAVVRYDRFD